MTISSPTILPSIDGTELLGGILCFDGRNSDRLNFISHAGVIGSFNGRTRGRMLVSRETDTLSGLTAKEADVLACEFNRPIMVGDMELTLLRSGFMLGGAQLFANYQNTSLLYSGQLNFGPRLFTAPVQTCSAETLLLETGPSEKSEPAVTLEKAEADIIAAVQSCHTHNKLPVLFVNPAGMAQEIQQLLINHGFRVRVHSSIFLFNKRYREQGANLSHATVFQGKVAAGDIYLHPKHLQASPILNSATPTIRYVIGNSIGTHGRPHSPTDNHQGDTTSLAYPESADLQALKEYVSYVNPKQVYTLGAKAQRCAELISSKTCRATAITHPEQLSLF